MSHDIRIRRRLHPLAGGLVALAALTSCDGQNAFAPGAGTTGDQSAPVVVIQKPSDPAASPVGDSVYVKTRISDNMGVDSLVLFGISLRGDPNLGTETTVVRYEPKLVHFETAVTDTIVERYLLATGDKTRETSTLFAVAYDGQGNAASDSVRMTIGGPRVEFLTIEEDMPITVGRPLNLQLFVADPEKIVDLSVDITGAFQREIEFTFDTPPDTVTVDTLVQVPAGLTGTVEVTGFARNALGVAGQDGPVTLQLVTQEGGDETPPQVSVSPSANDRLELTDRFKVVMNAVDNTQGSGVARMGFTVLGISSRRKDTTITVVDSVMADPVGGNLRVDLTFLPFNVDELNLPDTLVYEITGWAYDGDGNCAAATVADALLSQPCETLATGETVASTRTGIRMTRTMVSGRTVSLPRGGTIKDAAVDTMPGRRNLLLSNFDRNRIEVFNLDSEAFKDYTIGVGAEPWGMTTELTGDTLLVANSGGVNISKVDLTADPMREIDQERFFAPDAVIFDLNLEEGDAGFAFQVYEYPQPASPSFADRPQYIAVDSFNNYIFSTRTTSVGDIGTARKAYFPDGAERTEVKLFVEHGRNAPADDWWAMAHIDSIGAGFVLVTTQSGFQFYSPQLTIYDHEPGFPSQVIQASANLNEDGLNAVESAVGRVAAAGSDIFVDPGAIWNIPNFGFSDETFVTASGDAGWVLIGEGGTSPTGRVMMYRASQRDTTDLSATLRVWDEVINAADVVRGIGLNYDGTLGVARGLSAYFFDQELQLNGRVELPGSGGGAGAALHPLHADQRTLENFDGEYRPDTHIAFVGTSEGTIDIIDTFKFTRIGQITLRDVITGPLRAILPFEEDNTGLTCPTIPVEDQVGNTIGRTVQLYSGGDFTQPLGVGQTTDESCIVVKLFGITSAGGVVVVPVRKTDIFKYHPNRR